MSTLNKRPWQYLYTYRWQKASEGFKRKHPLCQECLKQGKTSEVDVVDHIVPHKGNRKLFWDRNNWQGLCKHCHDSVKAFQESRGFAPGCRVDGLPLDDDHPWNEGEGGVNP
jgi:5-methylcytosine-specific restriction enzyme A